jgi:hypothetical protein
MHWAVGGIHFGASNPNPIAARGVCLCLGFQRLASIDRLRSDPPDLKVKWNSIKLHCTALLALAAASALLLPLPLPLPAGSNSAQRTTL